MIHTLTIIRFLFPFLLLLAFFCLYKKPYRCMQSFMWRMVVFDSARKFYLSIMMLTLIFINWCCCMDRAQSGSWTVKHPDAGTFEQKDCR